MKENVGTVRYHAVNTLSLQPDDMGQVQPNLLAVQLECEKSKFKKIQDLARMTAHCGLRGY